jgi:type II secretory pathway component PulM
MARSERRRKLPDAPPASSPWKKFVTIISVLATIASLFAFFWGTIWPAVLAGVHYVKEWGQAFARLDRLQEQVNQLEEEVAELQEEAHPPPPDPGSLQGILRIALGASFLLLVLVALNQG